MGYEKKKKWKDDQDKGGFIGVYFELLDHTAFRELSEAPIRVLLHCFRKAYGSGRYEKIFKFTYPEAQNRLKISDSTFQRAMKQLHSIGFIDYYSPGGLRNEQKIAKCYQLSLRWKKWGTPAFDEKKDNHFKSIHG